MQKYDFYIAGRWRNKDNIKPVLDAVRACGSSAYCFIENEYAGEKVEFKQDGDPEVFMQQSEAMAQDDPLIRKIFEADIAAERAAAAILVVLPVGIAGHIEAGVAYGMGKKCYAIGQPEKTETLYCIFDKIFPDIPALEAWLRERN
ncbi:MAG TPA: hypothetical protein VD735_01410 [Candidatus Saccharimonadales bacterium]|nr:hypothetical protein [Candidatus Saccharimonadales bacterium]